MRFLPKKEVTIPGTETVRWLAAPSAAAFATMYAKSSAIVALNGKAASEISVEEQIGIHAALLAACLFEDEALTTRTFANGEEAADSLPAAVMSDFASQALALGNEGGKAEALGARFPDSPGTS